MTGVSRTFKYGVNGTEALHSLNDFKRDVSQRLTVHAHNNTFVLPLYDCM